MAINGFGAPVSGLQANQFRQDVAANNVANVNTDAFRASTVQTTDAAYINDIGQGTRVSATYAPPRPGPIAIDAASSASGGVVEQSNTDMIAERTNQLNAQNAYSSNISMMQSADISAQALMNLTA